MDEKIYVKLSFLLNGSVVEVRTFDLRNESLQINSIIPLPYGGYLLTVSIKKDNKDTRRVLAYVNDGMSGAMQQVNIPIPLTDDFGIFPNNTFWDITTVTETNWTYITSKPLL